MDKKLKEYAALLIELGVNLQQGETLAIACPVECCDLAEEAARAGIVSFNVGDLSSSQAADALDQRGIAVRGGARENSPS